MMPTGTRNYLMELLMGQVQAEQRGAEVEERTNMLPLVRYNDGTTGFGVPGAVYGPAQSAYNMLTTDRLNRALMGDDQAMQQSTRDSFDAASLAAVGGLTMPKPTNSLGMFGGRMAKTADHAALAKAEDMASRGLPREQIWDETGWFQGVDGKWRFEIDDSQTFFTEHQQARHAIDEQPIEGSAAFVYRHPEMWKAYPDEAKMPVRIGRSVAGFDGAYDGKQIYGTAASTGQARELMLHELQHALQDRENFARGANDLYGHPIDAVKAEARKAYERRQATYDPTHPDEVLLRELGMEKDLSKGWDEMSSREQMEWWDAGRGRLYRNSAGETEARTVEARRDLTPEQRRARAPWLDYDVPESEQIVRFR